MTVLIASLFVLGATSVSAVAEEDNKVYPGAACQPLSNTTSYRRNPVNGSITNLGPATSTFICPLARDVVGPWAVEFGGVTLSGSALSSCRFVTVSTTGGSIATGPSAIRPLTRSLRRLQFADGDVNIGVFPEGSEMFVCTLVSGSGVLAYSITENDGEN